MTNQVILFFPMFSSFFVEFVEIGFTVQSTFTSTMEFHLTIIKNMLKKMCMNFWLDDWLDHSVHSLIQTLAFSVSQAGRGFVSWKFHHYQSSLSQMTYYDVRLELHDTSRIHVSLILIYPHLNVRFVW